MSWFCQCEVLNRCNHALQIDIQQITARWPPCLRSLGCISSRRLQSDVIVALSTHFTGLTALDIRFCDAVSDM